MSRVLPRPAKALLVVSALILLAVLLGQFWARLSSLSMFNKSITVGTSAPSAVTTHRLNYNVPSSASVGSLEYEYCTNSPFPGTACTAPAGLDLTSTIISTQTGITGFSVHANTTANRLVLDRPASVVGPVAVEHLLGNITNPSLTESTIYVRISTFASTDGTGARIDEGAAAFSTSGGLGAVAFVPPYINFCAGLSVALNCSTTSGSLYDFGELSPTSTKTATSQFAGATNDPTGYIVYLLGTTMTSGNNIIVPSGIPQASAIGASQFGINLRDNSNPDAGIDPAGAGTSTPTANYNNPNNFKFQNGEAIAASPLSTDYNRHTVTYIINISPSQPAGTYSTTLTYLAVASF